jgi:hypothetical protein
LQHGMHLRPRGAVHLRARGSLRPLLARQINAPRHARRAGTAATRARGGGASAGAAPRQRLRAMLIAHAPRQAASLRCTAPVLRWARAELAAQIPPRILRAGASRAPRAPAVAMLSLCCTRAGCAVAAGCQLEAAPARHAPDPAPGFTRHRVRFTRGVLRGGARYYWARPAPPEPQRTSVCVRKEVSRLSKLAEQI